MSSEDMPEIKEVDIEACQAKVVHESVHEAEGESPQALKEAIQAEKDKALRAHAELENFRKRKEAELESYKKYAQEKLILALLPVLDSFDRACEHAQSQPQAQDILDGFMLIQKQFHAVIEKSGVVAIEALNQAFDPHQHQAVMEEEVENVASGTVIKEMQKGYSLHQKVIRPSMVVVAK